MISLIIFHMAVFAVLGWFTAGYLRDRRKLGEAAQLLHLEKEHENYLKEQIRVLTDRLRKMAPFGKLVLERLLKEEPQPILCIPVKAGRHIVGGVLEVTPQEINLLGWSVPPPEYEALRQYFCQSRLRYSRHEEEGSGFTEEIRIKGHPVIERPEYPAKEEHDQKSEEG